MPEPAYASEVDWRRRHAAAHEHRLRAIQAGDLETEDYWTQRLIYIQSGLPGARIPVREAFLDEVFTFGATQAAIRDDEQPARIRNIRQPKAPGLTMDEITRITELATAPYVYGLEDPPTRDEARRALRERRVYEDIRPAVQVLSIIAAPDETRLAVINLELARLDALISERQDIIDRRTEHDELGHGLKVPYGKKFSTDRGKTWIPWFEHLGLTSDAPAMVNGGTAPLLTHEFHGIQVVIDNSVPVGKVDFLTVHGRIRYEIGNPGPGVRVGAEHDPEGRIK